MFGSSNTPRAKTGGRLINYIASWDSYAPPITLNYDGQNAVPTLFGGILTALHWLLLIGWLAYTVFNLVHVSWSINSYTTSGYE